jgi:CSLREA domain-containing protein
MTRRLAGSCGGRGRRRSRRYLLTGAAGLFLLCAASVAGAADTDFSDGITVDSTVDAPDASVGDGLCSDSQGRCTLRAAVQEANATIGVQTIYLSAATYVLTVLGAAEDTAATGDLDLTDSVIIVGAGSASTVIDANGALTGDRVFHLKDLSGLGLVVTLEDLAVTNGLVLNTNGGGIFVEAAEGDEGGPGGGGGGGGGGLVLVDPMEPPRILALEPAETAFSLTLRRVKVSGNTADSNLLDAEGKPIGGSGGGIYSGAALVLEDSEISGNTAAANGGGFYAGGVVTLSGTSVTTNTAEGGGGIFETGSHISFYSECAIAGNAAVGGGGLTSRTQVTIQLTNCTIDGNTATDVGAGIQANGVINLVFSTVTGNASGTAAPFGGAGLNSFANGSFRLWSTLVADNLTGTGEEEGEGEPSERNCGCTGGACTPLVQFLSQGHNLEDIDTCFFDDATDLPSTDPGIGPLDSTDPLAPVRPLLAGSAAIDAGHGAPLCPATDQRGVTRPIDGDSDTVAACDIGAFELDPVLFYDGFETGDTSRWSATKSGSS